MKTVAKTLDGIKTLAGIKILAGTLLLTALANGFASCAEARFLSFAEELRRARMAIGQEAECRVLVEDIYARCELRTAGTHAILIQFADVQGSMLPRKSVVLTRGTLEPAQFNGVLAAYGLPAEVTSRCMALEGGRSASDGGGYEVYVGGYNVTCNRDVVTITYARPF